MTRRCLGIITMLLGAATLAGACSAETAGVAREVPSSGTSQTSTGNSNSPSSQPRLSPPIERPRLDLAAAKENPCSLLSDSFMKSYGSFRPGKIGDDRGIRQCEFDPTTSASPLVTLQIFINSGGLEGAYQRRARFTSFVPGQVRGYASVQTANANGPGNCAISVGVNDADLLQVDISATPGTPNFGTPCAPVVPIINETVQMAGG